jgi:hypothetical protein
VGRFNLYYTTTNLWLRSYRLTKKKIGGIIYETPLVTAALDKI